MIVTILGEGVESERFSIGIEAILQMIYHKKMFLLDSKDRYKSHTPCLALLANQYRCVQILTNISGFVKN